MFTKFNLYGIMFKCHLQLLMLFPFFSQVNYVLRNKLDFTGLIPFSVLDLQQFES